MNSLPDATKTLVQSSSWSTISTFDVEPEIMKFILSEATLKAVSFWSKLNLLSIYYSGMIKRQKCTHSKLNPPPWNIF